MTKGIIEEKFEMNSYLLDIANLTTNERILIRNWLIAYKHDLITKIKQLDKQNPSYSKGIIFTKELIGDNQE